jgi:hypothetical protein
MLKLIVIELYNEILMDLFRGKIPSQTECPIGRKIFAGKSENPWTWEYMGIVDCDL